MALAGLRARPIPGYAIDVVSSERSIDAWTVRRPDLVQLGAGGPTTGAARAAARAIGLRTVVSHHRALAPDAVTEPRLFLSPSATADRVLRGHGVDPSRIARWQPGVDRSAFHPGRYAPDTLPNGFTVLYAGPLQAEHGLELLSDAFQIARDHNPRRRLAVAGEGPAGDLLRRTLGSALTELGPVDLLAQSGNDISEPSDGRRMMAG
jgi:glycosyltransferase involved in cell wall biosynthesis